MLQGYQDEVSPQPPQRGIPRRMVLRLAGLTVVSMAGSSLAFLGCSQQPIVSPSSLPPSTLPPVGTTLYTYRRHSSYVTTVAWSPNSKRIASGSYDDTVQVWVAL